MKRIYLNYAIKKPYLFFLFVSIGIGTILFLLMTTKVPVISTHTARIEKSQDQYLLSCDEAIFGTKIDTIFLYKDKNENTYKISDYEVLNENQILIRHIDDSILTSIDDNFIAINIEVSLRDTTLFEEIFIQGGRN